VRVPCRIFLIYFSFFIYSSLCLYLFQHLKVTGLSLTEKDLNVKKKMFEMSMLEKTLFWLIFYTWSVRCKGQISSAANSILPNVSFQNTFSDFFSWKCDFCQICSLFTLSNILGVRHWHLRNIDCLTACTTCFVCFISTVNSNSKGKRKRKDAYALLRPAPVAGR